MYKFSKIYSGGEPDFEEGDVFKLTVPLDQNYVFRNEVSENLSVTPKVTELLQKDSAYTTAMLAEVLGISRKTVSKRLKSLKDKGIIERIGSDRKGYWKLYL